MNSKMFNKLIYGIIRNLIMISYGFYYILIRHKNKLEGFRSLNTIQHNENVYKAFLRITPKDYHLFSFLRIKLTVQAIPYSDIREQFGNIGTKRKELNIYLTNT